MKKRFWTIPLMVLAVACTVFLGGCGGPSVEELIREDLETAFSEVSPDNEELLTAMTDSSDGGFETLGIDTQEFAKAYLDGGLPTRLRRSRLTRRPAPPMPRLCSR